MGVKSWRSAIGPAAGVLVFAGAASGQQQLDQEQLLYNGGMSARTLPGYTVWQSFTAGLSGTLTQIDMGFFNDMSGDGVLRIYSGSGTAGALLQMQSVPVVGVTQPQVTWNSWAVGVPVTTGLEYTFELTPNSLTLPDPYGVCLGDPNPYPGGELGLNDPSGSYETNFDAVFRTWVTVAAPCYPNCDGSTVAPILNVLDFGCFLNRFAAGDSYANCDGSTTPPVLNVLDFTCFLNKFAAGCS